MTCGGEHTVEKTGDELYSTLENELLTNDIPVNLIRKGYFQ